MHRSNLTGRLTALGSAFVLCFYATALKRDDAFGWVAIAEGELAGFVFGSLEGDSIMSRLLRQNPAGWLAACLRSALAHPIQFSQALRGLLFNRAVSGRRLQPELDFLAVPPAWRGKGIGAQLLRQFGQEIARRGRRTFGLSVERDNQHAVRFYEACGGRLDQDPASGGALLRFTFPAGPWDERAGSH